MKDDDKPHIVFTPQECDWLSCDDHLCPYTHRDMWQYRKLDGTLSNGFRTEEDAIKAYRLANHP